MRPLLLMLIVIGACDFEPAPPAKKAPAPAAQPSAGSAGPGSAKPAAPAPPAAPPQAPPMVLDAGVDAPMEVKQECVDTGAHLAQVLIDEAKDPTQKAAIEQDKTRMIRRVAEACTRDNWKPEALACFQKATSSAEMDVCAKDLTLRN